MELVISTETECPAGLMGRSSPIARMATEAGVIGAKVAAGRIRSWTVRPREYLFQVLPQFPELLSEFVQCRLGRRAAFNARAVISSHLGLRFWPNSEPLPSLCRSSERPEQMYATGDTHARGRLSGKGNGPLKGYTGRSPQEAACQTTTVPLAAAAAGTAARAHQVRSPGVDPCPVRPECSSRSRHASSCSSSSTGHRVRDRTLRYPEDRGFMLDRADGVHMDKPFCRALRAAAAESYSRPRPVRRPGRN